MDSRSCVRLLARCIGAEHGAAGWLGKLLVEDPMVPESQRLALNDERQARAFRATARLFVQDDEPRALVRMGGPVEPAPEIFDVAQRLLEALAGATERRGFFRRDLPLDSPQALTGIAAQAVASALRARASA
jgi:hypothetical protein